MSVAPRDVLAEVRRVARETIGDGALGVEPDQRLVEDLALDSLRRLSLAVALENHFRVRLDPEDEEGLRTVGDLVRVIEAKLDRGT